MFFPENMFCHGHDHKSFATHYVKTFFEYWSLSFPAIGPIISPFYPISNPSHDISNDDATLFREQVIKNTSVNGEDKVKDQKPTNRYEKFEEILANNAPANKELSWKYREKWVSEMDISTMYLAKSHNIGKAEASSHSINGLNHSPRNSGENFI